MAGNLFNVTLVGDKVLAARLRGLGPPALAALRGRIETLTIQLQTLVVTGKLHGQVLHQRSGALARSIQRRIEATEQAVFGIVFSAGDVKYAAIHEFGGRTPPHEIYPTKAKALAFAVGGRMVFAAKVNHPGSVMPERSFLRSSLGDMRGKITTGLKETLVAQLQGAIIG